MAKYNPTLIKERIYAEWGSLKHVDLNGTSPYSIPATDVRFLKLDKNKIKLKFVWEKGAKVSDLVKKYQSDYGFNASFFWNGNPIADCKIGDKVLSQGYDIIGGAQMTKWHGFAYKNGIPQINQFNLNDNYGTDGFLFKTTQLLVSNGNLAYDWYASVEGTAKDIYKDAKGNMVRAQRTMIGIDANGDLLLSIADGRTVWDRGLTSEEQALYLRSKGAVMALNCDGGGSTVLADQTGSLGQNKGSAERIVNHAVLIYLQDDLEPQRNKADLVDNQIRYMMSFVNGSGDGVERWSLNYLEQVYDIMVSKGLL